MEQDHNPESKLEIHFGFDSKSYTLLNRVSTEFAGFNFPQLAGLHTEEAFTVLHGYVYSLASRSSKRMDRINEVFSRIDEIDEFDVVVNYVRRNSLWNSIRGKTEPEEMLRFTVENYRELD